MNESDSVPQLKGQKKKIEQEVEDYSVLERAS